MKVIEFPKEKTDAESAKQFLKMVSDLVEKGEYKPCAFVVLMIEEHGLIPLGVNLTRHEVISYLEVAKHSLIESLRDTQ